MNKFDNKWIMYHELHRLQRQGMSPPQIASEFGFDTRTVKKILAMNEQEYLDLQDQLLTRTRKLAPYDWQLWGGSRLSKFFNDRGIYHPDDMSGIILDSYHRYLTGKDIKLDEQIKFYQDYWKKPNDQNKKK